MGLQSLVLCSDEKILRVLRRVLSDLEINVEQCSGADAAIRKLTRHRYEAVILDCDDLQVANRVFASVRSAPCNKHAIAVAIIDNQRGVHAAFGLGAHFALCKPISAERARTSFRAARALMKCERRRNARVPIELPISLIPQKGPPQKATSVDLSEGGIALRLPRSLQKSGVLRIKFSLPGTDCVMECAVEMAWENADSQAGLRFVDLAPQLRGELKSWIARHSPEVESDDPPAPCKLTDLSLGGCYLEMQAPFPVRTKVSLIMSISDLQLRADGVVQVAHPEVGMGVQFGRATLQQREQVHKFIQALTSNGGNPPELVVEPEGIADPEPPPAEGSALPEADDPLLVLFRQKSELNTQSFLSELRRQRNTQHAAAATA